MSKDPEGRGLPTRLLRGAVKWALRAVVLAFVFLLAWAFQSRTLPDLDSWHRVDLQEEFEADRAKDGFTFSDYLELEDRLFDELRRKVVDECVPAENVSGIIRYVRGGSNNPLEFDRNWNRSFELAPRVPTGGAVLLHGLTDSPYSLRRVGEILHAQGMHVVGLRLPGHGTIPAGLTTATWEDWLAAARLAVRHVAKAVGDRGPLLIVGYSTGGALALKYAMEARGSKDDPSPTRIVLFSPAVGVTPFAVLAHLHVVFSFIPYFEKFKWLSVEPEFDPYKYVSFPKNAADQSHEISAALQEQLRDFDESGRMGELPPILAFQSIIDDTVLIHSLVDDLFSRVQDPDSELVLFDINRRAGIADFIKSDPGDLVKEIESRRGRRYRLTVVTNESEISPAVVTRSRPAGSNDAVTTPLGLSWPFQVFSLSHLATPMPPDDPLYGDGSTSEGGLPLGSLVLRGERHLLLISAMDAMRLRHNPFFPFVERRIVESVKKR